MTNLMTAIRRFILCGLLLTMPISGCAVAAGGLGSVLLTQAASVAGVALLLGGVPLEFESPEECYHSLMEPKNRKTLRADAAKVGAEGNLKQYAASQCGYER